MIKKASVEDVPMLSELLNLLFDQEKDFQPDPEKQQSGLKLILENREVGQILVLKDQDNIVGMINILFTISTALGGKVAIIEDMIVHPDFRGAGHGCTLLKEAIKEAQAQQCKRITLLTDFDNAAAIGFYERHGFVKSEMIPLRLML